MKLLLNVSYDDKDIVKKLGAHWNPNLKKWYVQDEQDYEKFIPWILQGQEEAYIVKDYFYLIFGTKTCYRCNQPTSVIGFGIENYAEVIDPNVYDTDSPISWQSGTIHIVPFIDNLPSGVYKYLEDKFHFYNSYSKTIDDYYFANHCEHCNALQGSYFLFDEVDSPFFINSVADVQQLDLYQVQLKYDIITDLDLRCCSTDYLIKKSANIHQIIIKDSK